MKRFSVHMVYMLNSADKDVFCIKKMPHMIDSLYSHHIVIVSRPVVVLSSYSLFIFFTGIIITTTFSCVNIALFILEFSNSLQTVCCRECFDDNT